MSAKTYWNLLVLFGVLCQGITGTLSEKDIDETSELFVRKKRVINRAQDKIQPIRNAPYVVTVKQLRGRQSCVGVILSKNIVLTVAQCVQFNMVQGRVYSGTAVTARHSHGANLDRHNITDKRELMNSHASRPEDGIALITVTPHFIYSVNTRNILLAEGHNQHGLNGTVSGWGCNEAGNPGTEHPDHLRSITVPIISNRECARLYGRSFPIFDSDICTFDATGYQYCGVSDSGAPLVITDNRHVKKLTGINLRMGVVGSRRYPDIFANVQHPIYRIWMANNIRELNNIHNTQST